MPDQEKTEEPTPRKRRKAREEGQVAKSNEVNSALLLLAIWVILRFYGPTMIEELSIFFQRTFERTLTLRVSEGNIVQFTLETMSTLLMLMTPLFLGAVVVGLFANLIQVGFMLSGKVVSPNLNRINPIEGAKKIVSRRALVELIKSTMKAGIIAFIAYSVIRGNFSRLIALGFMSRPDALALVGSTAVDIALRSSLILCILAAFDYLYQRWEHEKNLRMTKQEVKEERKQTEGSPELRSRIREKQREMATSRMMQEVPEADVVITNPIHLAVALAYDERDMTAPVVVAKGQRKVAERMKEIAKEHKVPVVENRRLARLLYETTEIGEEIPYHLYRAVAEMLAFVYRLQES